MAEKLKELLEKINREGIEQAEEKARSIESEAKADAEKVLKDARNDAKKIVEDARNQAGKTKETTDTALKQASRDLVLSLKDEIKRILNKITAGETARAMSSENIAVILKSLIEKFIEKGGKNSDITVLLKKEDLEKLKNASILKLEQKLKGGMEFKPSPSVNAGFSISFDKGKSFFDFTDEGLTQALCVYLNPELSKLFK